MFTRPNWKDPTSYRTIEDATLQLIAWEFLRRNPDYQNSWAEYAGRVRKIAAPDTEVAHYVEVLLSNRASVQDWGKIGDGEKLNALRGKLGEMGYYCAYPDNPYRFASLHCQYGELWGLQRLVNPATKYGGFGVTFRETASAVSIPTRHGLEALVKATNGRETLEAFRYTQLPAQSIPRKS